eukprot:GEMP01016841.1.p1 GENE.GEMP01016841.1~~GEMP01016841.1.p1  ORF type:complete len:417 (+),score=55.46 GEMP01016841.1:14-1264(+)
MEPVETQSREIQFGDPASVPRFVCPQIWTVQVDAEVGPAAILANVPAHAIYVTAKLHPGMYSVVTNSIGTVGSPVDFNGISGKILSITDTADSKTRTQMVDGILIGVEHFRRCRFGPFPRDWFIPDSVINARAKLPLYPQSMWMKVLRHYGELEGAWVLQEGPSKIYLVALWKSSEAVRKVLTEGLGRYVRLPRHSAARPLEVTIVEDDNKPIAAPTSVSQDIPAEIQGISTKGMSAMQFQAFEALAQRVELLEKENAEMKELLLELQKAEMVAKIDRAALDAIRWGVPSGSKFQLAPIPPPTGEAPWKSRTTMTVPNVPIIPKAPMIQMAPPPPIRSDSPPPFPIVAGRGDLASAGAAARAARRASSQDTAPWKRLKSGNGAAYDEVPPAQNEKTDVEAKINDYHNLLLGVGPKS